MKHISILIAAILFSILFYEQSIGLNLALFAIVSMVVLLCQDASPFKEKRVWVIAAAYLFTAVMVFVHDSTLAIVANCISFFTLVGAVSQSGTSIYIYWLNGIYSTIAGAFHRQVDRNDASAKSSWKQHLDLKHLAKLIGIPLVFIILFILLYQHGNPVFEKLIGKISFEFINFQWLLFTLMGYYLFSNMSQPVQVEPATSKDLKLLNALSKSENFSEAPLKKEHQLGTTLLGLLNLLLVFYIITDIVSMSTSEVSAASDLSNQVHNGINTLIDSIIIAIIIILYFFRGNLNFYAENKMLKIISFVWIGLNVVLIGLIVIKNQSYISSFGLTYKRIGVHIYILMTLIGLVTTFLKVLHIKNLAYLFRKNLQVAFTLLILLSGVNWDNTITKYNLTQADDFDISYLINLSNRNATVLEALKNERPISETDKRAIELKYQNYETDLQQRHWQEFTYESFRLNTNSKDPDSE